MFSESCPAVDMPVVELWFQTGRKRRLTKVGVVHTVVIELVWRLRKGGCGVIRGNVEVEGL